MLPQIFGLSPHFFWGGGKNIKFWTTFSATSHSTPHISGTKRRIDKQKNMLVSIYNVSPKSWPTFHDLWPRNGWDPFRHSDPPFGGHYVATIKVATPLVIIITQLDSWFLFYRPMAGYRPRRCSMSEQPMARLYISRGCRAEHNCLRWYSIYTAVRHLTTRPLRLLQPFHLPSFVTSCLLPSSLPQPVWRGLCFHRRLSVC